MKPVYMLAAAAALFVSNAALAAPIFESFDRSDSATLGSDWTQQAGTAGILNNQAVAGASAPGDFSLATYNGAGGNSISFDIFNNGSGVQYVAGVLGFGNGDNYFVKVQNNGRGSAFDTFGFANGNNDFGFFGLLTRSFTEARVTISFIGTVATLDITPNDSARQVYTNDFFTAPTGSQVGLGFFGAATADNFAATTAPLPPSGVPEPASWALMITGFGLAGGMMRRRASLRLRAA